MTKVIYCLYCCLATNPLAELLRSYPSTGQTTLEVMAAPGVTRDQLYTLLDMTPGLEYCEVDRDSGELEFSLVYSLLICTVFQLH